MSAFTWTDPGLAARTYAFLYDTIDLLQVQMDENVWRKVYGVAPARDRSVGWTRPVFYAKRRDPGTSFDSEWDTPEPPESFAPPPRTYESAAKRSFEAQINDAYLCGMHAFNNVANRVILTPPDVLQTIELFEPLRSRYASLEHLQVAGLREGMFLLPLRITERNDLNPLDDNEVFPKQKCTLQLIEEAGGLIIYQPSPGGQYGHFVSLTRNKMAPLDRDLWTVHSFDRLETRGESATAALDDYLLSRFASGLSQVERAREQRRRELGRSGIAGESFLALLPLALNYVEGPEQSLDVAGKIVQVLQRTLVRRSLSRLRAIVAFGTQPDAEYDLLGPPAISPNALDELCFVISRGLEVSPATGLVSTSLFTGTDQTNVAAFVTTTHAIDADINRSAEMMGIALLREYDNGWTREPLVVPVDDDGRKNASNKRRRTPDTIELSVAQRYDQILLALRQIRSVLRELPGVSVFFNPETEREPYDKVLRLLSNRRWLRYTALLLVSTALIEEVETLAIIQSRIMSADVRRTMILFFTAASYNMRSFGIKFDRGHPVLQLFLRLTTAARPDYLPIEDAPDYFRPFLEGAANTMTGSFVSAYLDGRYEWYEWLLLAAQRNLVAFPRLSLAPLRLHRQRSAAPLPAIEQQAGIVFDDGSHSYDLQADFVALLRKTLFRLPLAGYDFQLVATGLAVQSFREETRPNIAEIFRDAGAAFLADALAKGFFVSQDEALLWVHTLAFDERYALPANDPTGGWAAAAKDTTTHRLDDARRAVLVERAAQYGFNEVHLAAFGTLTRADDGRQILRNNPTRVPLPSPGDTWRDTRPDSNALLATVAIESLRLRKR